MDHGEVETLFPTVEDVADAHAAADRLMAAYPNAATTHVTPIDAAWFPALCRSYPKPMPFVPILDDDLIRWWGQDCLWQAQDERYTADQVRIIPGPVSVAGIDRVDEPVASLLGRFEAAAAERLAASGAVATPVAMAMQAATEETGTPVVFAAVSDPVSVGLVDSLEAPGSNLTGTSDYLDTAAVMNLMFVQNPELQKVGLLHDLGQDSAASAIESAKAYLEDKGVEVMERTGTSVDEIALAAQALVSDGVQAVFTPTDNTVMKSELTIYETFAEAGIPHYTGADSFALNGAFLGYGVDYANLGAETANMIASILLDGADPAATAVKTFDNGTATINTEICEQLGIDFDELSETFAPYCTKVQSIVTAESFDDVQ